MDSCVKIDLGSACALESLDEQEVKTQCPVCRGTCKCKACLPNRLKTIQSHLVLTLDPVIGAVAAGNSVVIKHPSLLLQHLPCFFKYVQEYMHNSAVRIIEGGVSETSVLLEQRWDTIFYTGRSGTQSISILPRDDLLDANFYQDG